MEGEEPCGGSKSTVSTMAEKSAAAWEEFLQRMQDGGFGLHELDVSPSTDVSALVLEMLPRLQNETVVLCLLVKKLKLALQNTRSDSHEMQRSYSNSTRSSSTATIGEVTEPDYDDPETSWDDIRKLGLEEVKARLKRGTVTQSNVTIYINYVSMLFYVLIVWSNTVRRAFT